VGLLSKARNAFAFMRGHGVELKKDVWEREYQGGEWDYLHSLEQLPRYSVLVGYIQRLRPQAAVLDVGCGDGFLQRLLAPYGYERYVGTDLSNAAIASAQQAADERTAFVQCDAATWNPDGSFDVIVFNEVLYYFHQPVDILRRYESCLRPHGFFIVSMFSRAGHTAGIWRALQRAYVCPHTTSVVSVGHSRWNIGIVARDRGHIRRAGPAQS
jgi:2-polyprenyl-6-hydroxyphenyl methylase/3-demethylubiquinone-9 3-methyltransferase